MLITVHAAAEYFEISAKYLQSNPKYIPFIKTKIKRDDVSMFDITAYNKSIEDKENELNFCIDMVNFAEFVIKMLGEDEFYKNIPSKKRQDIKRGFEKSSFALSIAELVKDTYVHEWYKDYENYEEVEEIDYIPFEDREPLTASFIMNRYWSNSETVESIAQELNVPVHWVRSEIRRLGLQKKDNGIKLRGKKDYVMPKEERKKHENQPHAKPIVQICPKTFKVVKEYSSQGAVERYGYRRENVRKAIKSGGLSKGYLWAFKGLEKPTIKVAKRKGNLDSKLQAYKYEKPTKAEFEKVYLLQNRTLEECAEYFKCHKGTMAHLAREYGLRKRTGKINLEELKTLYLDKGLQAKEIACITGRTTKTIATYLSKNGIKRLIS